MNRRLKVFAHWLGGRWHKVSPSELIRFLAAKKVGQRAEPFILNITESDQYLRVWLNGLSHPLYWPKNMDLRFLHQVITELFDPKDWHYYQIPETQVGKEDIVLDCGASEGLFSLMAAQECKKVFAIEPLPNFLDSLKLTFAEMENVEILPFALSDHRGRGKISADGISSSLCNSGTDVDLATLDKLFLEAGVQVSYIKADLEGHEMMMLRGAKSLIAEYRPKIAITTYHRKEHYEEISKFLTTLCPQYRIKGTGIYAETGSPVMLHAWIE